MILVFFQETIQEHKERLDPNYPLDLIDHYLVRMEEEKENKLFSGKVTFSKNVEKLFQHILNCQAFNKQKNC